MSAACYPTEGFSVNTPKSWDTGNFISSQHLRLDSLSPPPQTTLPTTSSACLFDCRYASWSFVALNHCLLHLLGDKFMLVSLLFMILQLTTCEGMFPHALQLRFFKLGVAFPFYYARRGLSTLFFGGFEAKMAENLAVLTAWNVGADALSGLMGWRRFHREATEQLANVKGLPAATVHVDAGGEVPRVNAGKGKPTAPEEMASKAAPAVATAGEGAGRKAVAAAAVGDGDGLKGERASSSGFQGFAAAAAEIGTGALRSVAGQLEGQMG